MEQLSVAATKDNEQVFKLLSDLIHTNKEFQIMELFMRNPHHVFSTDHLMDRVWGLDSDTEIDVVWTNIGFLRKKLKKLNADIQIKTIRGAGYALEEGIC